MMYYVKKVFYAALVTVLFFGVEWLIKTPSSLFLQLVLYIAMGMLVGFFIVPDITVKSKTKAQNTFTYIFLSILSLFSIFISTGWFKFIPETISLPISDASNLFQIVLGIYIAINIGKEYKSKMKSHFD